MPSLVVSVKSGALDPTAGGSATARANTAVAEMTRMLSSNKNFDIVFLPLTGFLATLIIHRLSGEFLILN